MPNRIDRNAGRRSRFGSALPVALFCAGLALPSPGQAAEEMTAPAAPSMSFARVADLVLASPAIARVQVKSVIALPPERAPDLGAGRTRFYVEADTMGLIRGESVIARKVSFLIDGPTSKAKKPGLKGRTLLIFGKVGSRIDQFQLTSSTAVTEWSAANEALVRKVIAEAMAPDAPPAITGISSAFHVTGTILGEGETQIFLETANGSPISLSVIRRPDEKPHFSASLGEVVDEAASLPEPDTMLWYRLACGLPEQLPARPLRGLDRTETQAASRDYAAFRGALAPCERTAQPVI